MAARIIDGAAIAAEVRAEIAERVRAHVEAGRPRPKLVAVVHGEEQRGPGAIALTPGSVAR